MIEPLYSSVTCIMFVASAPLPAVNESPIAPTISMSPGRSSCTEFGIFSLLAPCLRSQKNGSFLSNCFCSFLND